MSHGDLARAPVAPPGVPAGRPLAFRVSLLPEGHEATSDPERVLATLLYGGATSTLPGTVPVPLPQVGDSPQVEVWSANGPVVRQEAGGATWAAADGMLFAALAVDAEGPGLERATQDAYETLLRGTAERGHPHLLRVWNVIPRINEEERNGLERYRAFCRARAEALEHHWGHRFERRLGAASAVGSQEGPLVIYALASRWPGQPRENPRQVSAWRYPASYGPRSPSFARAARCPAAIGEALLLSGTASILGHETVHVGDTVGQLAETMRNIDALVARPDLPPRPLDHLKVFLRCRGDLARVDAALRATVGPALPLLYLEADICRRDLLIEIEGLAG